VTTLGLESQEFTRAKCALVPASTPKRGHKNDLTRHHVVETDDGAMGGVAIWKGAFSRADGALLRMTGLGMGKRARAPNYTRART